MAHFLSPLPFVEFSAEWIFSTSEHEIEKSRPLNLRQPFVLVNTRPRKEIEQASFSKPSNILHAHLKELPKGVFYFFLSSNFYEYSHLTDKVHQVAEIDEYIPFLRPPQPTSTENVSTEFNEAKKIVCYLTS